ncbi:MAG: hypothetical protein ACI9Z9_002970, partial [Litorivivens sp.]
WALSKENALSFNWGQFAKVVNFFLSFNCANAAISATLN